METAHGDSKSRICKKEGKSNSTPNKEVLLDAAFKPLISIEGFRNCISLVGPFCDPRKSIAKVHTRPEHLWSFLKLLYKLFGACFSLDRHFYFFLSRFSAAPIKAALKAEGFFFYRHAFYA